MSKSSKGQKNFQQMQEFSGVHKHLLKSNTLWKLMEQAVKRVIERLASLLFVFTNPLLGTKVSDMLAKETAEKS